MRLIVGLGNPGREYDRTRHNVGFEVVDELSRRHAPGEAPRARFQGAAVEARGTPPGGGPAERCLLLKPTTFMNLSGRSVGEALRFYKLEPGSGLVVLVDDLALPVGAVRVRAKGGSGGHNGLSDIDRALGGAEYPRVRVGIGAKPAAMNQSDWVLSRFTDGEAAEVERSIKEAADAVELWLAEGVEAAMNRFNKKVDAGGGGAAGKRPKTHPAQERAPEQAGDQAGGQGGLQGGGRGATSETGGPADAVHPGWTG